MTTQGGVPTDNELEALRAFATLGISVAEFLGRMSNKIEVAECPRVDVFSFVATWKPSLGERANKDSFLRDLCAVLGVPGLDPKKGDLEREAGAVALNAEGREVTTYTAREFTRFIRDVVAIMMEATR